MPKKPTPAVKKVPVKVAAPVKPPEPSKRVVFQLYECYVKLQVAKQLIGEIGIFPGEKADSLSRQVAGLSQSIETIEKQYREEWFAMKGEVGE